MDITQTLAQKFNLEQFPADEQQQILGELGFIVAEGVLTRTIPELSEEDAALCDQLLASNTDFAALLDLLKNKVPNYQEIVDEEISLIQKTLT